jgi:pimeloyl-ACP methyl ester carboxylesterase
MLSVILTLSLCSLCLPDLPVPSLQAQGDTASVVGIWQGSLEVPPGTRIPLVFQISPGPEGGLAATLDSPMQGAMGIPVPVVRWDGTTLRLELPALGAVFEGARPEGEDQPGTRPATLSGTWQQGALAFPLLLTRTDLAPSLPRPQHPARPFPYREEEVRFRNDGAGIDLAGTLTLPPAPRPVVAQPGDSARTGPGFPAAILLTGSGPQDRDETILGHKPFLVLSDHLTRQGVAVLRFDDRGVGASGGDFAAATSLDFAGDAAAALAWLRAHPEINADAIGFVGHSEGGLLITLLEGEESPGGQVPADPFAFAVFLGGPALPGGEILLLQAEAIARASGAREDQVELLLQFQDRMQEVIRDEADPERRLERLEAVLRMSLDEMDPVDRTAQGIPPGQEDAWVEAQLASIASDWFRTFVIYDPRPALRATTVPVLALFGELDLQVPPAENASEMRAALEAAGNPDVTIHIFPSLNHLFQTAETGSPAEYAILEETLAPAALERISGWILERFGRDTRAR